MRRADDMLLRAWNDDERSRGAARSQSAAGALHGALLAVERLAAACGEDRFWKLLEKELRELNISMCIVTRFESDDAAQASIVWGFSEMDDLNSHAVKKPFPVSNLLPHEVMRRSRPHPLVVKSLIRRGCAIGTVVMSMTAADSAVYEALISVIPLAMD